MNRIRIHRLKTWAHLLNQILIGEKTWELRKYDRDFKEGDLLSLEGYLKEDKKYTGSSFLTKIDKIHTSATVPMIPKGFCIISFDLKSNFWGKLFVGSLNKIHDNSFIDDIGTIREFYKYLKKESEDKTVTIKSGSKVKSLSTFSRLFPITIEPPLVFDFLITGSLHAVMSGATILDNTPSLIAPPPPLDSKLSKITLYRVQVDIIPPTSPNDKLFIGDRYYWLEGLKIKSGKLLQIANNYAYFGEGSSINHVYLERKSKPSFFNDFKKAKNFLIERMEKRLLTLKTPKNEA